MVRALAVSIIVGIVVLFTAAGSPAQPIDSNPFGEGPEMISWIIYRQQTVAMQRQQLEIQRQRLGMQAQQIEMQAQPLRR